MDKKITIYFLLQEKKNFLFKNVVIRGWVKFFRNNRFIILNDGSTLKNIQVVVGKDIQNVILKQIIVGASLKITGRLIPSRGYNQDIEIIAKKIFLYSSTLFSNVNKTILQPKNHSFKYLRKQAHFRFRTSIFSSIMRIRHFLSCFIHNFFSENNFFYIQTPIITGIDCEGAGELFKITVSDDCADDINVFSKNSNTQLSNKIDFFKKSAYLTVSGQLAIETAALGLSRVYSFGPVFRAENSNTYKHLSEFWMIEPEIAFFNLIDNINFVEYFLKSTIKYIFEKCEEELFYINDYLVKNEILENNLNVVDRIKLIIDNDFIKMSYTEAIKILENNNKKFINHLAWGSDLNSEHEKFLVDVYIKKPVIIYNYPLNIKPFYMYVNDDGKTVKAMDVLFPVIGEIVGGSEREYREDVLLKQLHKFSINKKKLQWYIDTRKIGSIPHSGFGLGFDRLVQFITGMRNIRDVIPYPRTPGNLEF